MNIGDISDGERINCHGVYGTVIGKRSTRNRRSVLVKMENGFTLKLDTNRLSKPPAAPEQPSKQPWPDAHAPRAHADVF
jgi:hypothetical protein